MGIIVDGIIASGELPLTIGPVPACTASETVSLVIRYYAINANPSDLCFHDDALDLPARHACYGCQPWEGNLYAGHDQGFGNACTLGTSMSSHVRGLNGQFLITWMSWAGGPVLAPIPAGSTLDIDGGPPVPGQDPGQPARVFAVVYQVRNLALSNIGSFVCPPPLLPVTGADGDGVTEAVPFVGTSAAAEGPPNASGALSTVIGCDPDKYLNEPNGDVVAFSLALIAPQYQSFKTRTLLGCTCHKSQVTVGYDIYAPTLTSFSPGVDATDAAPVTTINWIPDDTGNPTSNKTFDMHALFGHEIFGGGLYVASYAWSDPPRANKSVSFVPCVCQVDAYQRRTDTGGNAVFYCGSDGGLPDCTAPGFLRARGYPGLGVGLASAVPPAGVMRAHALLQDGARGA